LKVKTVVVCTSGLRRGLVAASDLAGVAGVDVILEFSSLLNSDYKGQKLSIERCVYDYMFT
jgi:alkyl hydroperoxide reductase subunit AhpF